MTLYNVSLSKEEWIEIYTSLYWAWEELNQKDQNLGSVITEIKNQLSFL